MAKKKDEAPDPALAGGPVTVERIVDQAIAGTDLPKREDQTLAEWAAKFESDELSRRVLELCKAASIADWAGARHWGHQAEDQWLREQVGGKRADHR